MAPISESGIEAGSVNYDPSAEASEVSDVASRLQSFPLQIIDSSCRQA